MTRSRGHCASPESLYSENIKVSFIVLAASVVRHNEYTHFAAK